MKSVACRCFCICLVIISSSLFGATPPTRIMLLGDSLTSGNYGDVYPPPVQGGFRPRLRQLLLNAGYNLDFIGTLTTLSDHPDLLTDPEHEGWGGYTIDDLDAKIETSFAVLPDPDLILLLIGANDYFPEHAPNLAYLEEAPVRLVNFIDHIVALQPFAKILVANLPPRTDVYPSITYLYPGTGYDADMAVRDKYNLFIPAIVEDQQDLGREVYFVDLRRPPPECCNIADLADEIRQVHPSPDGYYKMATNWFDAIAAVWDPTDPGTRTLSVGSVNPSSGVAITVNSGTGDGVTPFDRSFPNETTVTLTAPAVSPSGHSFQLWERNGVFYSISATTTVTLNSSCNMTAVYVKALATSNVPEAASYTLVYSLDLPTSAAYNLNGVPYELDKSSAVGAFNRVAYYLELQYSVSPVFHAWVSMDAFTADVSKIGVPSFETGAIFQQNVANMNVRSSIMGIVTGNGLTGGNIEFYCGNYAPQNSYGVPNASDTLHDWGDIGSLTATPEDYGFGAMQIHNHAASQTIFAFNGWGGVPSPGVDKVDLGIGNYAGTNPDWTFAQNAGSYSYRKLQIYVRNGSPPPIRTLTVNSSNPGTGVSVSVYPSDENGNGNGTTSFTRSYPSGAIVNLTAPASVGDNTFLKWQQDGVDYSGGTAITVTVAANTTMTAVYASPPRTLTVTSFNPASGVNVTVAPTDRNGQKDGTTSFTRSYANGTVVSLTAPATIGNNIFVKWRRNGADYGGGAAAVNVTMDANATMTAVYGSTVQGAYVFYNNSAWDGNNPTANTSDDNAIATDKVPLLPGGKGAFANYTSYSRGLNGIMVDISSLPGTPTVSDFILKVGNTSTPETWASASAPNSVTVVHGGGAGGSDRVKIIWPDGAIRKQWLQVTVLTTEQTGLAASYVFYFGNGVADTNNSTSNADITTSDVVRILNNYTLSAAVTSIHDLNRDKLVATADVVIALNNFSLGPESLQLIDLR